MKCDARRVADYDSCKLPGDFYITPPNPHEGGMRRLTFLCPCGCGDIAGVRVRDDGLRDEQAWGWDRNEDKPTVDPSIELKSGCKWHGHLKAGVFESC